MEIIGTKFYFRFKIIKNFSMEKPSWTLYLRFVSVIKLFIINLFSGNLVIYMLIVAVLQAYILRLRHMICSWVYPARARERAVHLYNMILQLRGSFSTYVRRQIQRNTEEQATIEKVLILHQMVQYL